MPTHSQAQRWRYPATVWLIVLGAVFGTETAVMFALPWILPAEPSRMMETTVDALLLTLVLAPLLWWLLVRPLQEASRLKAAFLADLFASMEADRRQTAYDLHDGVGQSLTMLISGLRSAAPTFENPDQQRRCLELKQLAKQALLDIKRLALGLRPSLLDDLGLAPALERVVADANENQTIHVTLDAVAVENTRLAGAIETALFRIAQEALANVVKHSQATHATVTLKRHADEIVLEVKDDGVGIPATVLRGRNPGHLGLTGMRERAALLGGRLEITGASGRGTTLTGVLPLQEEPS